MDNNEHVPKECLFCKQPVSDIDKRIIKDKGIETLVLRSKELKQSHHWKAAINTDEVVQKNLFYLFYFILFNRQDQWSQKNHYIEN